MKLKRVDPKDCGCTDCLTGYSKSINHCSKKQLKKVFKHKLTNASGCTIVKTKLTKSFGSGRQFNFKASFTYEH